MNRNHIVEQALSAPPEAIRRILSMAIRAAAPDLFVVPANDIYGNVFRYAAKGHCVLTKAAEIDNDIHLTVDKGQIRGQPQTAWWKVEWQGANLEFVEIQLMEGFQRTAFVLLMGLDQKAVQGFLIALEKFSAEVDGAVLVFQDGCWKYDEELFQDIQISTFENLVLPPGFAEQVREDVHQWLGSRELYEEHGIPWKRGMILVGPPGNGKTHMIKALANDLGISTLYVRGFSSERSSDAQNIASVFHKARICAPTLLILEDLDTLVNAENRSYFLNELDGFARNTGILAVASANNPAHLDPALVNRPSRFDRRYMFGLPEENQRTKYLQFFTSSFDPKLRLDDTQATAVAAATEGFSYAYLKELVLSSMMAWISSGRTASFHAIMQENAAPLLEQMRIDPEPTPVLPTVDAGDPMTKYMRSMRKNKR